MTTITIRNHFDTNTFGIIKMSRTLGGQKKTEVILKSSSKYAADKKVEELKSYYKSIGRQAKLVYVSTAYGSSDRITKTEII